MSSPLPTVDLPPDYIPTQEEVQGDSYGYCYMTLSVFPLKEDEHDHQQ